MVTIIIGKEQRYNAGDGELAEACLVVRTAAQRAGGRSCPARRILPRRPRRAKMVQLSYPARALCGLRCLVPGRTRLSAGYGSSPPLRLARWCARYLPGPRRFALAEGQQRRGAVEARYHARRAIIPAAHPVPR